MPWFSPAVGCSSLPAPLGHDQPRPVVGQLPIIGGDAATLLFGEPYAPLQLLFTHHAVTWTLLLWLLTAEHARRVWCGSLVFAVVLAGVTAVALLYHPGPGLPPGAPVAVHGPWYFSGAEAALRLVPSWLLLLLPLATVGALGLLGHVAPTAGVGLRGAEPGIGGEPDVVRGNLRE